MNSDNCCDFDILCVLLGPVYSQFNNHKSILFFVVILSTFSKVNAFSSALSPLLTPWIGYGFFVPVIQSVLLSSTLDWLMCWLLYTSPSIGFPIPWAFATAAFFFLSTCMSIAPLPNTWSPTSDPLMLYPPLLPRLPRAAQRCAGSGRISASLKTCFLSWTRPFLVV